VKVLLRLIGLMKPHREMMALAIALSLVAMLANIGLMAVSGWFIAAMGLAGAAGATMNYFTPAAIIRALAITRTGGRYAERVISHDATFRVLAGLKRWFYDRIEPLAPAGLADHASGDLLARIRNDIERLELVFLRVLSPIIVAVVTALVVALVMSRYSGLVAIMFVSLFAVAGGLLPVLVARAGAEPSRMVTRTTARMKDELVDGLHGLAELKLAGLEDQFAHRIGDLSDRYIAEEARLARLQGVSIAGVGLAANVALLGVLLLLIPLLKDGGLAPADMPMLMLLVVASFDAAAPLPLATQSLAGTLASAQRLFDLVDRQLVVTDPAHPMPMPSGSRLGFERVDFRYAEGRPRVLSDISIDLAEGNRIAIVGETGSGKSSLINLAVRFWDPEAGRLTLGGAPVDQLPLEALRARIAVVPQTPHLFATTIRENLRIARPEATEGHIEAAARAAQIHDFIVSLPAGYDTYVGTHGHLLSGGEARRLAVARALLKDAPVLLLDEPTEGLDRLTAERLIDHVIKDRRRSVLLVTHRSTGLRQMDEIIVLAGGRIAARGTFDELSRPGGPLHVVVALLDEPVEEAPAP